MAIQATSNFTYNYGTYETPYFRVTLQLPENGLETRVKCFMYPSQQAYLSGSSFLKVFPFTFSNLSAPEENSANNVVNKYLLFATEQITGSLATLSSGSTFEIVEIPLSSSL